MRRFTILLIALLLSLITLADEGMWVPLFLKGYPIEQMKAKGFKLTAEDIYSINHSSLKDAVMQFGGGCTASIISPDGLILTNHHCGYSAIVNHSTVEHDYLTNGFWAPTMKDELPNPGLTVTFLIYMEDVTDKILSKLPQDLTERERRMIIKQITDFIVDSVEAHWKGKYDASVEPFYYGNQYILIVTQTFRDVRLVGAPPSAIGKFGGETDNWMWPRHTGDFSLFRIYANKDNEPADYSPDNIPYRPKKYLKISLKGYKPGDFTMVFGYPGHTQEYVPSYTVDNVMNLIDPVRIKIRQAKLDVLMPALNESPETRLMYAKQVARIANGWKKWQGEIKGLRRLQAIKKKKQFEEKFEKWTQTPEGAPYKGLLNRYKQVYKKYSTFQKAFYYYVEAVYYTELFQYAGRINKLMNELANAQTAKDFDQIKNKIIKQAKNYADKHKAHIERRLVNKVMDLYINDLDRQFVPDILIELRDQAQKPELKFFGLGVGDMLFNNSIFLNPQILSKTLAGLKPKKSDKKIQELKNDDLLKLYNALTDNFRTLTQPQISQMRLTLDSLNRVYMKAQMLFQPDKHFYPDANFTLRVAFGTVGGYKPRDAVYYDYYTTLEGIIEKDDPDIYDYNVPEKLKQLYEKKDYGPYADKDGKMHVCFIANNHTTGGNSGSPVLDAEGNLIGLNFDRTWESTMSDLMYDPDRCRNIMVDIRYILFLIDKYAGAKRLIDEMEFVN